MKKFKLIKRWYGEELNNSFAKIYTNKQDAVKDGNDWLTDSKLSNEFRIGRNFEIIEILTKN